MNLRPTGANENQRRHPRAGGGPCQEELDSRPRGNDMRAVIFRRALGGKPEGGAWPPTSRLLNFSTTKPREQSENVYENKGQGQEVNGLRSVHRPPAHPRK